MIVIYGKKANITINELAKYFVAKYGNRADCWFELDMVEHDKMTTTQTREMDRLVRKHIDRIDTFLGTLKIHEKIFRD